MNPYKKAESRRFVDKPGEKAHHENAMAAARVVIVRSKKAVSEEGKIDAREVARIIERGFGILTGLAAPTEAVMSLFRSDDRVGIKINTLGGPSICTRPEVSQSLALWLARNGLRERNLLIWDRTNRELRDAGYRIAAGREGIKVFGTDAGGAGYGTSPLSHLNVGSLFSSIQTDYVTSSISLAVLKDHGLAGVTAGMKNYFGSIHNPNKYHDSRCDPFVAEVFDAPPIRTKHRISILDALVVQYHRGPSFHARWADRHGAFVFGLDPVAADRVGWEIIDRLRSAKGLPSLKEEGRDPLYLATAEKMGIGRAALSAIEILEENL